MNGYVLMADLELDHLGDCFNEIYNGTCELRKWENKDPQSIIKMIDQFIEDSWNN